MSTIRRAIVSVSDKSGVVEFARKLSALGIEILSTGGTARALGEGAVNPVKVSDYTGAPEILGGRVKTLHPRIHGGILARSTDEHRAELSANDIGAIDMVVVNLYPFQATVAADGVTFGDAIENIDIGGPCMVRAAAKNHERVTVIVDPSDYEAVLGEIESSGGAVSPETRFRLAVKAYAHTAAYDAAIVAYLSSLDGAPRREDQPERAAFPGILNVQLGRQRTLRYGENPHQGAAFYRVESTRPAAGSLAAARLLQGKPPSYNNYLDIDGAFACCREFDEPTAVVVKHTNPCGVATAANVADAYRLARETDPTSSFGGIVSLNREVDGALAEKLVETFLECVVAPGFSPAAREVLAQKKNLRLFEVADMSRPKVGELAMRSVAGGLLVQDLDALVFAGEGLKVVTERTPSGEELDGLSFAWRVAKHVKSNAIVFARGQRTAAIGAGQMSRIDSVKLCQMKAQLPLEGAVVASDAFFPFRDGLDALADAGATAVVQPGGSIRDEEVIAAANERGIAMAFTGMRHFKH